MKNDTPPSNAMNSMGSVSLVSHAIYRVLHYMKFIDNDNDNDKGDSSNGDSSNGNDDVQCNPHLNHGVDEFFEG